MALHGDGRELKMKRQAQRPRQVRIIGGQWRSRIVRFADADDLRPTSDRVRETLFNWLGQDLTGKACLDLFAGSGALGFEALSRNARSVVMVERNATVRATLSRNATDLQAGSRLTIVAGDALQFLHVCGPLFDVIFCDPPFREDCFPALWPALREALAEGGVVYAESGRELVAPAPWLKLKSGKAGQVSYQLMRVAPHG